MIWNYWQLLSLFGIDIVISIERCDIKVENDVIPKTIQNTQNDIYRLYRYFVIRDFLDLDKNQLKSDRKLLVTFFKCYRYCHIDTAIQC